MRRLTVRDCEHGCVCVGSESARARHVAPRQCARNANTSLEFFARMSRPSTNGGAFAAVGRGSAHTEEASHS